MADVAVDKELTELTEITAERVDAVKGAANGATFLLVKAMADDESLAADVDAALTKAEESTAAQNDLPDSAFAYIEPGGEKDEEGKTVPRSKRHFPVHDAAHTRNALARAPQSPFGDKAMPKIRAAAKKFGIEVDGDTAKADGDGTPGSPDWETQDSALLHQVATMLARANTLLGQAQGRERDELEAGVEDDPGDIWDLDDAMCCLEQALGVVGRMVFTEAAEATDGAGMAKAGRRLSTKSEQSLKEAIATLTALLAGDGKSSTQTEEPEGAAGTDKEDDVDAQELAKALQDNNAALAATITTGITAGLGDLLKSIATPPAAAATDSVAEGDAAKAAPAASDTNEALVKGLAAALKEAVTPLEERLAKVEATPRRGVGPLATVPRGRGSDTSSDLADEIKDLIAKSQAERNPDQANRLRERATMLSLSVGERTGRMRATVPYDLPAGD